MEVDLKASAESQASICSVFANAKRVMILWSLVEQERSVSEIASAIEASLQSTSQHLNLMKKMGILDSRRDGQTIYYRIVKNGLTERCQLLQKGANSCSRPTKMESELKSPSQLST